MGDIGQMTRKENKITTKSHGLREHECCTYFQIKTYHICFNWIHVSKHNHTFKHECLMEDLQKDRKKVCYFKKDSSQVIDQKRKQIVDAVLQ